MRISLACLLGLSFSATAFADNGTENEDPKKSKERVGYASYYHDKFHGRRTANGEIYDKTALTAAHLKLPMGTRVKVTRLDNGREIVVRINDRGPYSNYMIDLSRAAAAELGLVGIKRKVSVAVLDKKGNTVGTIDETGNIVSADSPTTYDSPVPMEGLEEVTFLEDQQPPVITAEGELQRSGAGAKRAAAAASGQEIEERAPRRGGKRGRHAHGKASRKHGKHAAKAHGKHTKHGKHAAKAHGKHAKHSKAHAGKKAKGGK